MAALELTRPILIGVTGNIGSGKSSFCAFLEAVGLQVYHADAIAKSVLNEPHILKALMARWGIGITLDGNPRADVIADKVVGNPEELVFLNSVVHPGTLEKMQRLVEQSNASVLLFEVPLLFEAKLEDCFDYLVLITSPAEQRTSRIINRDKGIREQVERRITAQIPDTEKAARCDLVIRNERQLNDLRGQAQKFIASIPSIIPKKVRPFHSNS